MDVNDSVLVISRQAQKSKYFIIKKVVGVFSTMAPFLMRKMILEK